MIQEEKLSDTEMMKEEGLSDTNSQDIISQQTASSSLLLKS